MKTSGLEEEDSLAENTDRAALHPLDQFRAFAALAEKGQGIEVIAASFSVTPAVVRQRLKLASVSPKLLALYEEDALTLDRRKPAPHRRFASAPPKPSMLPRNPVKRASFSMPPPSF